ncbi:MAG: hypothetical protein ACLP6E_18175 [Acidimicrobiales bacterium]
MTDQDTLAATPDQEDASDGEPVSSPEPDGAAKGVLRSAATLGVAFAFYLGLSVLLWWGAWSSHPTTVTTCACNDPSLFVWFLEWPAYAIAHGHNLFYSTSLFHPQGINLLSNTGVLSLGVPLAPVTWLFGPVATLNVASTLGPALSALAMFWLLRRFVSWAPAAFAGGLVFGFSPFAFDNLAVAHLNTELLALVPLTIGCLDELCMRQSRRWPLVGAALGLLVTVQFFLSTEMLVIIGFCAVAGLVILVLYAAVFRRTELLTKAPHALGGFAVAITVAVVLLSYPVWFALDGPAHLSGLVWPIAKPGIAGIDLGNLWHLRFLGAQAVHLFAGYEGPALPQAEYLGVGLLGVLGAGLVSYRRDLRLWFFGAVGLVSVALSLPVTSSYWVPWRVLEHVPLVQNVAAARFFGMTTACAAIMLGVIVDRTHATAYGVIARLINRFRSARTSSHRAVDAVSSALRSGVGRASDRRRLTGVAGIVGGGAAAAVALAVAAVALVPMGSAVAENVPLTTQGVALPKWFANDGAHLAAGQVVLAYPPPVTGGSAMTWQAIDLLRFAMATGGGPESIPARAGKERAGLDVITQASLILSPPPPATTSNVEAVRQALSGWGVTIVVVPDPAGLEPHYSRAASTAWALGMFTLAIGRPPRFEDDAWVWTGVRSPSRRMAITARAFATCTGAGLSVTADPLGVPDCVLRPAA